MSDLNFSISKAKKTLQSNPPLFRDHSQLSSSNLSTTSAVSVSPHNPGPSQKMLSCNLTVLDAFSGVRDYLRRVECEHQRLVHDIESLPNSGPTTTCTDTEILIMKATSQATLLCLEQCLAILHYQQQQPTKVIIKADLLYCAIQPTALSIIISEIIFCSQSKQTRMGAHPFLDILVQRNPLISKEYLIFRGKFLQQTHLFVLKLNAVFFLRMRSESAVSVLSDKTLSGTTA